MKINWKKVFAIAVLVLVIGTMIAVALVNWDNSFILNKTP
jgi:hypothetical protein